MTYTQKTSYRHSAFGFPLRLRGVALALPALLLSAQGAIAQDGTVDAAAIDVETFRRGAEMGNPGAQYQLGLLHFDGFGVPLDPAETVRLHRLAAAQGHAGAHNSLRDRYRYGQGVSRDAAESVFWLRALAERGSPGAQDNLALFYLFGRGVAPNGAESARWLRMAAEQNDDNNRARKYTLGLRYFRGEGIAQDYAEAARWFEAAAELNGNLAPNALAERLLALMHRMGFGVPQDHAEAEKWYCRGLAVAMPAKRNCAAGAAAPGVNASLYNRRVRWAQRPMVQTRATGAQGGNPADLYWLVRMYYFNGFIWGYDLLPNGELPPALEGSIVAHPEWSGAQPDAWLMTLAEGGDPAAQFYAGQMYANGYGAPRDGAEAARWYRMAAEQGHEMAHNALSAAYRSGRGIPRDSMESIRLLRALADLGNAAARYQLALRYRWGEGVPQDNGEYVRLLLLAAEQSFNNSYNAYMALGNAYLRGDGVAQDDAEAARWFGLAAAANPDNSLADRRIAAMHYYGKIPQETAADSIAKLVSDGSRSAAASYELGLMRYHGKGAPQDVDEALRLLRGAAASLARPRWVLAALHEEGVASPDIGGEVILADLLSETASGAPNALATAFGSAFAGLGAQAVGSLDESGRLSTQAGGVCLAVDGVRAPLLFVSSSQINFQVPAEAAAESEAVVEAVSGCGTAEERRSSPVSFTIAARRPRFFLLEGFGTLIAMHGGSGALVAEGGSIPGASPAKPGEVVVLYGTGFGAVSPALAGGELAQEARGVTASVSARMVVVDNTPRANSLFGRYRGVVHWERNTRLYAAPESNFDADVSYAGIVPRFAGLYQVNVRIPENASGGILGLVVTVDDGGGNPIRAGGLIVVAEE